MPRAPHRVAVEQSFGEGPAVVRACRADRAVFVAESHEQNGLAIGVSEKCSAGLDARRVDSLYEIRTRELGRTAHWFLRMEYSPDNSTFRCLGVPCLLRRFRTSTRRDQSLWKIC